MGTLEIDKRIFFLIAVFPLLIVVVPPCEGQTSHGYDEYGGVSLLAGMKTGWFHVEEIGGRCYFVTPKGHAFFSLGATHAIECIRLDELDLFETRYRKSEEKLADFFLTKFKEWGYNSSGYGPLPTIEKRIPYVATIWTEGPRCLLWLWKFVANKLDETFWSSAVISGNNLLLRGVDHLYCIAE